MDGEKEAVEYFFDLSETFSQNIRDTVTAIVKDERIEGVTVQVHSHEPTVKFLMVPFSTSFTLYVDAYVRGSNYKMVVGLTLGSEQFQCSAKVLRNNFPHGEEVIVYPEDKQNHWIPDLKRNSLYAVLLDRILLIKRHMQETQQ